MALIDTMPETDETANKLSKAIAYWCSEGEITQGMKDTLIYSVREQFERFPEDQTQEQYDILKDILTNNE